MDTPGPNRALWIAIAILALGVVVDFGYSYTKAKHMREWGQKVVAWTTHVQNVHFPSPGAPPGGDPPATDHNPPPPPPPDW